MNPETPDPSNEAEHQEVDLDAIDTAREEMRAKMQGHNWRQQGIEVFCTSCPFRHGFYVQPGTFVKGTDEEGKPILDKMF